MKQIHVYVYGHYDSRGGCIMLIAPDRVTAHTAYIKGFGYESLDDKTPEQTEHQRRVDHEVHKLMYPNGAAQVILDDFLYEVDLQLPDNVPEPDEMGIELICGFDNAPYCGEIYGLVPKGKAMDIARNGDDIDWTPEMLKLVPQSADTESEEVLIDEEQRIWRIVDLAEDAFGVILAKVNEGERTGEQGNEGTSAA